MKKHLKIFLTTIVLTFSFCFINSVYAYSYYGLELNQEFFNSLWSTIEGKSTSDLYFNSYSSNYIFHQSDYPYVSCERGYSNSNFYECYFFKDISDYGTVYNNQIFSILNPNKTDTIYFFYYKNNGDIRSGVPTTQENGKFWSRIYVANSSSYGYMKSVTNFTINNRITKSFDYETGPKTYNVNFHLNDGLVMDFSQPLNPNIIELDYQIETTNDELSDYLEDIIILKDDYSFGGWYYDTNLTQPYDPANTLSSDINLYAKWIPNPNITFHLNGGYIRIYDSNSSNNSGTSGGGSSSGGGRHEEQLITEDYSIKLPLDGINNYIESLVVEKYIMIFEGWYYDANFNNPYHVGDSITTDTSLYAKYRYERVEDFLSNTTLNEHYFDQDYNYAIINRGNHNDNVYIGLPFENFELEVYEFNESEYMVKDVSSDCLVPLYSYNKYYYYNINTLFTNNQEVLILPRALLDSLDPNNFDNPNDVYKFYLSDNAYISYTNDLSQAQIVDSNGETISINLQDSYELSQQYKELYSDPENIFSQINIFLDKMKKTTSAIKEIFEYLFNSLNSTMKSFIIYLIVLILITTIIRFSRRG